MLKKYALIGLTAVSGVVTGLHYMSKGWQGIETFTYDIYQKSRLAKYVSLLEEDETIDINLIISEASNKLKVPIALLKGMIHVESGGNVDAYSPKGAIGLMQIMPFNSKRCGVRTNRLWDERTNIMCGAQIISEEIKISKGNLKRALLSYNGGSLCTTKCESYANNVMIKTAQYMTESKDI